MLADTYATMEASLPHWFLVAVMPYLIFVTIYLAVGFAFLPLDAYPEAIKKSAVLHFFFWQKVPKD